ncbi:DNA polymerase III subunit gamma/tau [Candidatus Daviesbacteria bacterium]|nr:DNA polymerase III subunit gamma/tau [Candidatus Daviesbacteria bacterium]
MTYYLKYRPQTLDEIVGQKHIKEPLYQAFINDKLSHAYLFCGLRGTGKTSTARILAKMVNCESSESRVKSQEKSSNYPCNKCDSCLSITNGSNMDLIEIDAASNRGIDDIRDLKEKIKLVPTAGKKKVYIIDEVHMLTQEAFNALLKTLEEPPNHVMFILATTEPQKIPQTIMSRVQKMEFKQAGTEDLIELLEKVVKKEKISIEDDAIRLLAKKSDGSFRDALKLLEQLAVSGGVISSQVIEQSLLTGGFEDVVLLLEAISKKDPGKSLAILSKQLEKGINTKEYLIYILDILRFMLLIQHGIVEPVKEDLGPEKLAEIQKLSGWFSQRDLVNAISFFQQAFEKIKVTSHPALPLEIAVVESSMGDQKPDSVILLSEGRAHPESNQLQDSGVIPPSAEFPRMTDIITPPGFSDTQNSDMPRLLDKWSYILETVKQYNYSLEALLKQAKVLSCEKGKLLLEVPYSFHQRILESPKNRQLLESVLADVLEKEVKVSCMLGIKPVRIEEIANVELAADDEVIRIAAEIFNSEPIN